MQRSHVMRVLTVLAAFVSGGLAVTMVSGTVSAVVQQATGGELPNQNTLDVLLAKDAIMQQIYNYCRGLDRMDKPLALQVWHPDGTAEFGGGRIQKGSEFVEGAFKFHESFIAHTHQMVQTIIKVDGDKAVSETYANTSMMQALDERRTQGVLMLGKGVSMSLIRGRYADRWSKRNGRWAIDHRRYIEDFRTVQEFPEQPRATAGRRDRTDPSYAIYPY